MNGGVNDSLGSNPDSIKFPILTSIDPQGVVEIGVRVVEEGLPLVSGVDDEDPSATWSRIRQRPATRED